MTEHATYKNKDKLEKNDGFASLPFSKKQLAAVVGVRKKKRDFQELASSLRKQNQNCF